MASKPEGKYMLYPAKEENEIIMQYTSATVKEEAEIDEEWLRRAEEVYGRSPKWMLLNVDESLGKITDLIEEEEKGLQSGSIKKRGAHGQVIEKLQELRGVLEHAKTMPTMPDALEVK